MPHPRGWGTFPRALADYVRRRHLITLDEAIRRMTSLPAKVFHLDRRGVLRPGWFADIVVFDGGRINDRATYASPFRPPAGIWFVMVNGKFVVVESESPLKRLRGARDITAALPGRFLPRAGTSSTPCCRLPDGMTEATTEGRGKKRWPGGRT
jgi:N-acyl-D-aspartate/D-glutamate deacylase